MDHNKVNVVFNRRWYDDEDFNIFDLKNFYSDLEFTKYLREVRNEFLAISQYFYSKFSKALWVPESKTVNKLIVLEKAKKIGFNVPSTYLVSEKSNLIELLEKHEKLITKASGDIWPIQTEQSLLTFLTKRITLKELEVIGDVFFPSLIQEEIEKEYAVRIFYFFGELHSMAILSQNDPTTEVDFRNYNHSKLSRMVPYQMDSKTSTLIVLLMNDLGLNTGSIDLIYKNDRYYFLEVNPVGQFDMVEVPCEYGLYEIIAKKLISLDPQNS